MHPLSLLGVYLPPPLHYRGGNHGLGRHLAVAHDGEGRHAVEAVPPEPQDQSAQSLEHRTVGGDLEDALLSRTEGSYSRRRTT